MATARINEIEKLFNVGDIDTLLDLVESSPEFDTFEEPRDDEPLDLDEWEDV